MTELVGQYSAFMQGYEASNNDEKLREKYDKLVAFMKDMANENRGHRHVDDISSQEMEMITLAKELLKEIGE